MRRPVDPRPVVTEVLPVLWDYMFSVWPAESRWPPAIFDLFRNMTGLQVMTFDATAWAEFRSGVERAGFTLREVSRIPHHEPEPVE